MRFLSLLFVSIFCLPGIYSQSNPQNGVVDVLNYVFELEINDSTDVIDGQATIGLLLREATNDFFVELKNRDATKGMEVHGVFVNGLPSCYYHEKDQIHIKNNTADWPVEQILELRVEYSGIPEDGLIISDNKFGVRSFFADNWPNRAHHWIPVVDHPSDKATVAFLITCPAHYQVIASGLLQGKEILTDGKVRYSYKTTLELPVKVMVFAASEFKVTNYGAVNGIPVTSWIYSQNKTGEMDYHIALDALRFFSDTIGPYIYEKLANVQSETRYGGMENAGNIFYSENSVNGMASVDALVVHEVAHHWFGNAVTEDNWQHLWLSEGFATYLTDLFWEKTYGKKAFHERLNSQREKVLKFGKKHDTAVVDTLVRDWNKLLNPYSYEKGAWVLHMLRQKVGDKTFFRILQQFYEQYKYGNAISSDFIRVAREVSGKDLTRFFEQWLFYRNNPDLKIEWYKEADRMYVQLHQRQPGPAYELDLEMEWGGMRYPLTVREKTARFKIEGAFREAGNPVFDPEDSCLFDREVTGLSSFKGFTGKDFKPVAPYPRLITEEDRKLLKAGDLLFQDLDCGPLCDAIESVTEGYRGADFSHIAMVSGIQEDTIWVIEAIGGKVRKTRLVDFLDRSQDAEGRPKVMVGRVKNSSIIQQAIEEAQKFYGKAYDDVFDIDNDSYYCSELVYYAFMDQGEPIFKLYPMTFKKPKTDEFDPAWIDYYQALGAAIPEGEPGLNPGGISRSGYVEMLFRFGNPSGYKD